MAESIRAQTASSLLEEELSILIGDYSIPHFTELSPDSLLMQSQYAKVIFHDIADTYPTDADICCRYSLTDGVTPSHGDRIALYRVGWSSVQEFIQFEWAPGPPITDGSELQVLFKASSLPKDVNEFYQLCYVTENDRVCGASVPFQFRHPHENELCAVLEAGDLVVVRSRTALTDEKLRQAVAAYEELQRKYKNLQKELQVLEENCAKGVKELKEAILLIAKLKTEKQELEKRVEDNLHFERHMERLQKDLLTLDAEKNQNLGKLAKAEHHIEVLSATVDTLSADKEHMAQLLRSETQNKSGVVAEVSQYKAQVDSLTYMLEALTESKELVAQELRIQQATNTELRDDIQQSEIQKRELQNKMTELEIEKKMVQELLEQTLNNEKVTEEKFQKIQNLEKEKEHLLSQLVQSASKREKDMKDVSEMYEGRLREEAKKKIAVEEKLLEYKVKDGERRKDNMEIAQVNKCLKQQLQEAQNIIAGNEQALSKLTNDKTTLEESMKSSVDSQKKVLECLSARLIELENESAPLRLQVEESNLQHKRQAHFREVFEDLENRIANLEITQEECVNGKTVQAERIDSIIHRLSEVNDEEEKLNCERRDVSDTRDTQVHDLALTNKNLEKLQRLSGDYLTEDDSVMLEIREVTSLQETVNDLPFFLESSKMRIVELDQHLKELEEEKSVLLQQKSQALERKKEYEKQEEDARLQLTELQDCEREIVREQGGQVTVLQDQLYQALNQNSEMLATGLTLEEELALERKDKTALLNRMKECGVSQDQQPSSLNSKDMKSCLEEEQQLKLRLQLAGAEYRKLYAEKKKVERRLAKLCHKLHDRKAKSSSLLFGQVGASITPPCAEQPATAELISLSQATGSSLDSDMSLLSQESGGTSLSLICPICSVAFPPGAHDLFTQHFDDHLS